jgi:hypothetical protein
VAADAETHSTHFPGRDVRMSCKPIQTSAAIRIEMRDGSLCGVLLAAGASRVIEGDDRSWRFDAAINFRGRGDKSIARQPHAGAQQRRCKLKNIGIAENVGISAFGFRRSDECSHWRARQGNVRVLGSDDHLRIRSEF